MTSNSRGFTLIEMMVVLGILSALLALALPRINRNQNNVKKVMRELAVLGKEIRNQARLKNMTFRLAFRAGDKNPAYRVESSPGPVPARALKDEKLSDEEKKALDAKAAFQKSEKFFKEEKKLPGDLLVKSVETITNPESVTQGMAYIYFSPEGLVEKSVVQIGPKDRDNWSLIYNPITGHADIVEKAVSLKDVEKR